jgi:hypothetical protein
MGAVGYLLDAIYPFARDQVEKMFVVSGGDGRLCSDEERLDGSMKCRFGKRAIRGG